VQSSDPYASLRERVMGERGVIMLIGATDTGKTTLGRYIARDALGFGQRVAFIDADVAASTVGPPACVGLKHVESATDLQHLHEADELRFVGSVHAQGVVLPHVVAAAALVERARRRQADLIVLDTTGVVGGVVGQTLKYHLSELAAPTLVIVMQRGGEMEPIIGMLHRFLGVRVARAEPHPDHVPLSPVERSEQRTKAFADALAEPLDRWRIQPTVFAPTLPEGFEDDKLDGMLVGIQDEHGACLGLGVVEHEVDHLRVATRHGEEMKGLRLGSMRIDLETHATTPVRLRQLFFGI
jgi:polynucleotide 5'-kinase involved in rRNA processing